jgi:hypothetical protein
MRFPSTHAPLRPGVPFSTRLLFGAKLHRTTAVMGNRAFVRAWAAHRAANATAIVQRSR